jgi:hypothetical protein
MRHNIMLDSLAIELYHLPLYNHQFISNQE